MNACRACGGVTRHFPGCSIVALKVRKILRELTAGESTCPICGDTWTVTPLEDCFMPMCGCFGFDDSAANPYRPCEPCGLKHIIECPKGDDGRELARI